MFCVFEQAADSMSIKRDYLRNGHLHISINEGESSAFPIHKVQYFTPLTRNQVYSFGILQMPDKTSITHFSYFQLVGKKSQALQRCLSNPKVTAAI